MSFLTYEQWDAIADSYIPILFLISLLLIAKEWWTTKSYSVLKSVLVLVVLVFASYLFNFIDRVLILWPRVGWDYSTHTGVSLSLVIYLSYIKPKFAPITLSTFLLYGLLMLYQQYHSVADIVSTAALISIVWFAVKYKLVPNLR